MKRTERAMQAIQSLLHAFEAGTIFRWLGCHIVKTGCPSDSWSLSNFLIMALNGTNDARGFRQWEKAGRRVKKGAHALWDYARFTAATPREAIRMSVHTFATTPSESARDRKKL